MLEGMKVPISARDDMNGLTLSCAVTPSAACVRLVDAHKPQRQLLALKQAIRDFPESMLRKYGENVVTLVGTIICQVVSPELSVSSTQMVLSTLTVDNFTQTPTHRHRMFKTSHKLRTRHTDTNKHSYSNVPHNSCELARISSGAESRRIGLLV